MTKLIIDSNIVFSAILNVNSHIGQIVLNGRIYYDFFAPEYVNNEILAHKAKIKELAHLEEDEFIELYVLILSKITLFNHSMVPLDIYQEAMEICQSIDIDDTVFVAFANSLDGKLWTGDFKLIRGLKAKGFTQYVTTKELYEDFLSKSRKE